MVRGMVTSRFFKENGEEEFYEVFENGDLLETNYGF